MTSPEVSFDGVCPLCGWEGAFRLAGPAVHAPRDFACGGCRATVVFQSEAAAILDEYERGGMQTLDELVTSDHFRTLSVLHIGSTGPIRNRIKWLDDYTETRFDPAQPLGSVLRDRPRLVNEDHQQLSFPDGRFDLLLSSHVLEHVPDWRKALEEAHRVLAGGGRYIFSIPGRVLPPRSRSRAELIDGEVRHLEEPQYHNSPEGEPALVFTTFGQDLVDVLEEIGFVAGIRRVHRVIRAASVNFVVVAAKPVG